MAENCHNYISTAVTIHGNSLREFIKLIDVAKKNQADWIVLQPLIKKIQQIKIVIIFIRN